MPAPIRAKGFIQALRRHASPEGRRKYEHTSLAAEGDKFLGVPMGQVFRLAKECVGMDLTEVERLLDSPIHEVRVGAVSIMDFQARSSKTPPAQRKALFDLYIRRHDRINTWDLVDRSAIFVVGGYLSDKPRAAL